MMNNKISTQHVEHNKGTRYFLRINLDFFYFYLFYFKLTVDQEGRDIKQSLYEKVDMGGSKLTEHVWMFPPFFNMDKGCKIKN